MSIGWMSRGSHRLLEIEVLSGWRMSAMSNVTIAWCQHLKERSSFHILIGEMTLTLIDVSFLLHFPIKNQWTISWMMMVLCPKMRCRPRCVYIRISPIKNRKSNKPKQKTTKNSILFRCIWPNFFIQICNLVWFAVFILTSKPNQI